MEETDRYKIQMTKQQEDGCFYRLDVKVPMRDGWIEDMYFVLQDYRGSFELNSFKLKHIKNDDEYVYFSTEVFIPTRAIYRTYFTFTANGQRKYINKNGLIVDNLGRDKKGKMSVNFDSPEWAKGATMYHIFVDRFYKGRKEPLKIMPRRDIHRSWDEPMTLGPNKDGIWNCDFYGGDLKGITEKLDYIKSLGTNIVYLSPIMYSQSNHRYDTGDYENVDPYAGTNDDLKELCEEAHKRGMYIVLDSVFNHTGNDSKYFNQFNTFDTVGAFQDPDSYYGRFYRYVMNGDKRYFYYWWGMDNLPVCDGYSPLWQDYIYGEGGVIDKWFDLGIDGLRLDVADELTDEFIEGIRKAVKRNKKDGLILGEVWKNPMRMCRGYVESGKGMDSVMDYSLIDALIRYFKYDDKYKLGYIIDDILNEYPDATIQTLMNFTSTHDISRAINIFATYDFQEHGEWAWNPNNSDLGYCRNCKLSLEQYKYARKVLEAYSFCLNFMPGIFSIFYGDEVGVQGLGNLENRKPFPWGDNHINDYGNLTYKDTELLEFFRKLGKIRNSEDFLKTAGLNVIDINDKYFMFERENKDGAALVAVNRTDNDTNIFIPGKYDNPTNIYDLNNSNKKILTPYGGVALIKK